MQPISASWTTDAAHLCKLDYSQLSSVTVQTIAKPRTVAHFTHALPHKCAKYTSIHSLCMSLVKPRPHRKRFQICFLNSPYHLEKRSWKVTLQGCFLWTYIYKNMQKNSKKFHGTYPLRSRTQTTIEESCLPAQQRPARPTTAIMPRTRYWNRVRGAKAYSGRKVTCITDKSMCVAKVNKTRSRLFALQAKQATSTPQKQEVCSPAYSQ